MNIKSYSFSFAVFIIYTVAAPLSAQADTQLGFSLWNQSEGTSEASFGIIYQGKFFYPPESIQMNKKINRSSPEALMECFFWALNKQDTAFSKQLYAPGELKTSFLPDADNKVMQILLCRKIEYGAFTILEANIFTATTNYPQLFYFHKIGGEYFASDLLDSDKAISFLDYYYSFSTVIGAPNSKEWRDINTNKSGGLYFTNYALGIKSILPPLVYRFEGKVFPSNSIVTNWPTQQKQDLKTSSGVLQAAMAALKSGNEAWYADLLHPIERTNIIHYGFKDQQNQTWESLLHSRFSKEMLKPKPDQIEILKEIQYGDSVILFFNSVGHDAKLGQSWLCFRRQGQNWYLSDKLNSGSNLLFDYLGIASSFRTKLFPSF